VNIPQGYKKTEIGVIPEDWEVVKLPLLTDKITSGGTPSRKNKEYFLNGLINWIKTGELRDTYIYESEEKITQKAVENSSAKVFPIDTLLIAMYGATIGKTAYLKVEAATNQACCAIIFDKEKADSHFYWQYFMFIKEDLISMGSGAGQPNISQKIIRDLNIPFPPLREQKKIAEILSTVDEKIAFVDKSIEETQTLKKGLMQKLLTEGIGHTEFKESELGRIPVEWEVMKLKNCSKINVGIATSTTEYFVDKGIPLIRNQNIKENKFDLTDMLYISNDFSKMNKSKVIKENDLLVIRTGYPGITSVVTKNMEGWQTFTTLIVRPNKTIINSYFLAYYMNSTFGKTYINKLKAGGAQKNLNTKSLEKLKISLPSLPEQEQIAKILSTADEKLEILREKKKAYERLKKGLMQKLLTGEVRV